MGFTGQIFATRIAIGLAVPSPQALAKTGGTLARGIQNIQSQVMQARRAQAGSLGQYQAELNKLNSATMSTTQKLNNEINVSLKRSLMKMDQTTNQALGKSFNNTKKGYSKLQSVLSKPLANQLMTGMGGLKGIDAMIQKTQNLNNMGRANRQEIIDPYENVTDLSAMLSNPFANFIPGCFAKAFFIILPKPFIILPPHAYSGIIPPSAKFGSSPCLFI